MKAALALLLAVSPAAACDWEKRVETDPMTDAKLCWIRSESAGIAFVIRGTDRPNVVAASAYPNPSVTIRIDDLPAIRMGTNAWQRDKALTDLLPQIRAGSRIRTLVQDYPAFRNGDAPVCTLPELLSSC